jgi:hypothetical protein
MAPFCVSQLEIMLLPQLSSLKTMHFALCGSLKIVRLV